MKVLTKLMEEQAKAKTIRRIVSAMNKVHHPEHRSREVVKHLQKMLHNVDTGTLDAVAERTEAAPSAYSDLVLGIEDFLLMDVTEAVPLFVRHYDDLFSSEVWDNKNSFNASSFVQALLMERYKLHEHVIEPEMEAKIIRLVMSLQRRATSGGAWLPGCLVDYPDDHDRIESILLSRYVASREDMEALLIASVPLSLTAGNL